MAPTTSTSAVDTAVIKAIILEHLGVTIDPDSLQDTSDLYNAGLTSLATVGLMLALEDHFNVEFTESMLGRATFRSITNIAEAIAKLSA